MSKHYDIRPLIRRVRETREREKMSEWRGYERWNRAGLVVMFGGLALFCLLQLSWNSQLPKKNYYLTLYSINEEPQCK